MAQYARMRWEGRRLWTSRGRQAASKGLEKALEHTLGVSQNQVPLEESILQKSGKVSVVELEGVITYGTKYAVRQHEELTWKHAPGRKAKYLEDPMNSERQAMLRLMAVPLSRWIGR